ncbi:alpha-tubulin N-acetyltransferase 1 [Mytilus galloprovincialis]|uniref:Alpha-tubulin N-acetyltransferase n=1 Tax=Mytilus galloprovincialis TaxID=29158 RepID=A0A8B6F7Z0_MYTGA|nr:alpha-tubulin N-acetyltransferase 1 [Mytilus galloprovincialis]
MEFDFNINYLFKDTVTKLDHKVTPYRKNANGYDYATLRKQLHQVIDRMGEASARAQGLHGPITLARKLELSDHILYVIKDAEANSGKGAAVGILKIGPKRLFVYDSLGRQHEMEPVCVLDFYVHESRQRMGCGKKLFEYFLKEQNINPKHLAIDKPSFKFSSFLNKHYNLKAVVTQVNNFVVFEGFFNGRTDMQGRRNGKPPAHPPRSHYNYRQGRNSPEDDVIIRRPNGIHSAQNWHTRDRPPSGRFSKASNNTYPARNDEHQTVNDQNLANRPLSGQVMHNDVINERLNPQLDLQQLTTAADHALGARANLYSRHGNTPPGSRPSSNTQRPSSNTRTKTNNDHAINRNYNDIGRPDSPPLLQRNGAQTNYKDKLNLHQDYQGRTGHLKYSPDVTVGSLPQIQQKQSPSPSSLYSPSWRTRTDYNWTVNGQVQNHQTISQRHYNHTRLW